MRLNVEYNADYVVSFLRYQIEAIHDVLDNVESGRKFGEYTNEKLKNIEKDIRWLRKQGLGR